MIKFDNTDDAEAAFTVLLGQQIFMHNHASQVESPWNADNEDFLILTVFCTIVTGSFSHL